MRLRAHSVFLHGALVALRPLTEDDWDLLLQWNNDPEALYFSEGDDVSTYSLEDMQGMYRGVSQSAFCFVVEFDGEPVGEGWLQQMNLERVLQRYPSRDCRRIDLLIGEKRLWGRGLGTDTIRTLTAFGFEGDNSDLIFGLVGDHNERSVRAFQRAGFRIDAQVPEPPGRKAKYTYDLVISRREWDED